MFKKLSYQYKLFIAFLVIIIPIIIASGMFFYRYNSKLIRNNVEDTSIKTLDLYKARVESRLQEMDKTLKTLHASESFREIAYHIPEESANYFDLNPSLSFDFKKIFLSALATDETLSSIRYVSINYDYVSGQTNSIAGKEHTLTKQQLSNHAFYEDIFTNPDHHIFSLPHEDPFSASSIPVISVIRPIRDNFQTYGFLEYSTSMDSITDILGLENTDESYSFAVLDETNTVLLNISQDSADFPDIYEDIGLSDADGFYYLDPNTLVCYSQSTLTGWTFVLQENTSKYSAGIKDLTRLIIMTYAAAVIILLIFLFILASNLAKPLRILKKKLSNIDINKEIDFNSHETNNEIVLLTKAIEDSINKIRYQKIQITEERNRTMKAHMNSMEAQINPHFLNNTLAVISACSMESGNTKVPKMCAELGDLLRYSIHYNNKPVTLENEISNIKSFLYIMKTRYEDMLEYTWDLDESLFEIEVPKLILQPLVENCFVHGFQETSPPWKLHIRSFRKENRWFVAISNNGSPFPETVIRYLEIQFENYKKYFNNTSRSSDLEKKGLGLENTIMRLAIFYQGKEYFKVLPHNQLTTIEIGGPL